MHLIVRLASRDLHRHAITQQLIGSQVGLIESDTGGIGCRHQLLQSSRDVRVGITTRFQVGLQQLRFDATVIVTLVPLTEIVVTQAVGPRLVREQRDDAVLRLAFGAGLFRHE